MTIEHFLQASHATGAFRAAVDEFLRSGRPSDRIGFERGCPPVKVERTLTKVLAEYPELPLESIELRAESGCEYFRGTLVLRAAGHEPHRVRFDWDCRWRAMEQGWTDYFGFPDQIRAAREFGWNCFRLWEGEPAAEPLAVPLPA